MRKICLASLLAAASTVSGCGVSYFTEPKSNPVIEDRLGNPLGGEIIGTLATTAERRIVLAPLQGENVGKFCAEPSPDAAEALVATFKAALEGSATTASSAEGQVKGELARSIATSIGALTKRSQGLQFFRDGVFALCQSRMNGFIEDEDEFKEQYYRLRDISADLIRLEISGPNWNAQPNVTVTAPKS